MPPAPHHVLAATAHHVPAALVPPTTLRTLVDWSWRLPAAFNWLGFECRLGADDPRVDFAGCCEAWDGGRDALLAALAREPALAGPGPAALVHAWAHEDALRACPSVWLEFDFLGAGAPVPFAFLCLDPACANTFRAPGVGEPPAPEALAAVAVRGATLLLGHAPKARSIELLRHAAAALPLTGRALHVAATPHRGHDDLRLHYALLARDLGAWLERIAWPGDHDAVAHALDLLGDGFRQVGVQLSVGDALRPTLGLEAYVTCGASGPELATWTRSLAALVELGACTRARADALLGWWGHETLVLPGAPWRVSVHRQFYVKLLVGAGPVQAKAYLAIFPRYTLL